MSELISVSTSSTDNYDIHIGENLTKELKDFIKKYNSDKVFVIVDEFVLDHHHQVFEDVLREKFPQMHTYKVPRGESSKSLYQFTEISDFILKHGVERGTPLVAIGGGVTGDLAGYVAASVLRGLPLIHIPTTLLAMVDSSIGGKTGINHDKGKNLIGSFYQPEAVFADLRYLNTLPEEEWVNGLSEIIKYGMIDSPDLLDEIQEILDDTGFDKPEPWKEIIAKSAGIKVDIVNEDVLEDGKRAFLNLGHTFAHVIELEGNYTWYSHGEAVYAGMFGAVYASNKLGAEIDLANLSRFKPLYKLSLGNVNSGVSELVAMMHKDKKVRDEQIQLILLEEMGSPYVFKVEDTKVVEEAWQFILNIFK